jgi:nicotinamide-nucleotide amidase
MAMPPKKCFTLGLIMVWFLCLGVSCAGESAWNRLEAGEDREPQPVRYMIVVTGGELLAGAYPDAHTVFITRTLRPLGLECIGSLTVDDTVEAIGKALRFASNDSSLIIVTGGLGPTENDVTREAISVYTGIELREDAEALEELARRFSVPIEELRPNLRRQTRVPVGGRPVKNPSGTALGMIVETVDPIIVALPGPPRELQPMLRDQLVPYLVGRFGTRPLRSSLTMRFVGIGQSLIDQTLRDHGLLLPDLTVSSHFEHGRVDFIFSLPYHHEKGPEELSVVRQGLLDHLGEYIYAQDEATSLEDRLLGLLESRKITLSLVEAGSGGALAAALGNSKGAGGVLLGAYSAPSLRQLYRLAASSSQDPDAVSLELLAQKAARRTGALWTVVTGEIREGEEGGIRLPVLLRLSDGRMEDREFRLAGTGEQARARFVTELLDHLRRKLT